MRHREVTSGPLPGTMGLGRARLQGNEMQRASFSHSGSSFLNNWTLGCPRPPPRGCCLPPSPLNPPEPRPGLPDTLLEEKGAPGPAPPPMLPAPLHSLPPPFRLHGGRLEGTAGAGEVTPALGRAAAPTPVPAPVPAPGGGEGMEARLSQCVGTRAVRDILWPSLDGD